MKNFLIICIFFLNMHNSFGQQQNDSLFLLLEDASNREKIDIYNEIALSYRGISYEKIIKYAHKAAQLAEEEHFPKKAITSLSNVAIAYVFTGNTDSAGILFREILQKAQATDDEQLRTNALFNLANFYYNTDKYDLALKLFIKALSQYEMMQDSLHIARSHQNIANIYTRNKNYDQALKSFSRAMKVYKSIQDSVRAFQLYSNLGMLYMKLNQYDSAAYFLKEGLIKAQMLHNQRSEMYHLNNLGLLLLEQKDYSGAIARFRETIRIADKVTFPYEKANNLLNIVQVFIQAKQADSALFYLHLSEPIIKQVQSLELERDANEYYSKIYSLQKDFYRALIAYKNYISLKDSVLGQEAQNKIAELNIRFETDIKESENRGLRSDLKLRKAREEILWILIGAASIIAIILVILLVFLRKHFRQKNLLNIKESLILKERLEYSKHELASKALHLACQNEFRMKILEASNELYSHLDDEGKSGMKALLSDLENNIDKSVWQEFELRFEQVHASFFEKLNKLYPELTPNDRRICAFLKLNMSTKDIALLIHRSPRSVESARYRLRKKFDLPPDQDFSQYLQTL